jgi:hypothetical protein
VASDVYRVRVRGAGKLARDFSRAQRHLQDEIVRAVRELGADARDAAERYAPEDTRDLIEALVSVPYFGRAGEPRATVRVGRLRGHRGAKRDNHDYLNVTRFGHRKSVIYPKHKRALKVHIEGHRNPHAAIVRASVTGVGHPPQADLQRAARRGGGGKRQIRRLQSAYRRRDWVQDAAIEIDRLAAEAERKLGRRVTRGLL